LLPENSKLTKSSPISLEAAGFFNIDLALKVKNWHIGEIYVEGKEISGVRYEFLMLRLDGFLRVVAPA